ncbi:MAG: Gfo/Idh/MocA family oxidoreductase [Candidatus Zixiibacteriota bacterium]|nr:MAG: Gfo/Idh/MocA family oxidoreductase [candidate division Zixibacteria bacterium]
MPVRIGQIGLGAWGRNLLRTFYNLPEARLVTGCDINTGQLSKISGVFPGVTWTKDYSELVSDPDLDAVVIATPPADHFKLASRALEAGKDVFVEKPLALDVDDGRKLIEIAGKNERILMVGHIMEYHPASLKLKEYISSGKLGRVYYLYSSRVNLGKVRDIENSLWSFAPHDISMIMFLLDKAPVGVTSTGASYLQKDIEDVTFLTLHFDDKTMAHIHVSWLDPHKERKLTVVGSKMMAVFDDTESTEKIRLYDKGVDTKLDYTTYGEYLSLRAGDIVIPRIDSTEPLIGECSHFIDCVKSRKRPTSDGRDGLRVLTVLTAAQNSMEKGGAPVDIKFDL